jgi:PIN domain nuclease of toxin-antitoxin system
MKILLDTHIFLWMFLTPKRISANVESLLKDSTNEIFLSSASSWEISIKYSIGKLKLPDAPEIYVPDRIKRANLRRLEITHEHTLAIANLPQIHKDPFDRLLITQANVGNLTLLSADSIFDKYSVKLINANTF